MYTVIDNTTVDAATALMKLRPCCVISDDLLGDKKHRLVVQHGSNRTIFTHARGEDDVVDKMVSHHPFHIARVK